MGAVIIAVVVILAVVVAYVVYEVTKPPPAQTEEQQLVGVVETVGPSFFVALGAGVNDVGEAFAA